MQFLKSALPAPRDARILLHLGEDLEKYRISDNPMVRSRKQELEEELGWWASALPENKAPFGTKRTYVLFPEINRLEKAAINSVFAEIAKTLQTEHAMLSIATHSTTVAQLTIDLLVRLGLQQTVQVFWHENKRILRGWVVDAQTAFATEAFSLSPAVDEDFIQQLDFGCGRTTTKL